MPALSEKRRNIGDYISGYVDGEGCFSVSFSRCKRLLVGWETKPSFSVSQNEDRAEVLYLLQKKFNGGFLRRDYSDKTLKYEIRSLPVLIKSVIPHFRKFPLISSKQQDFLLFEKICRLMAKGKHTTKKGLQKILPVAFKMNPSGKRKYTRENILQSLR